MNPFVHLGATEEIEVAHVAGDPLVRFGKGEHELWVAVAAKGAGERHDDPDRARRDRIQAAGLDSGRIPNWTLLTDSALWAEWRKRFQGDADLAFDAALRLAKRMAPQRCVEFQKQLHRIERALLGDTVSDTTYLEPVEHEEDSRLPLPFTGILAILKHLAWKRAGVRPWDAAP